MSDAPTYPPLALSVAGTWLTEASGGSRPVINPADETVLATLPLAGPAEIDAAAEAADRGFRLWRRRSPHERYRVLRQAADAMRAQAGALATTLTLEQGKPLAESTREVLLSADILDVQAEEGKRLYGRTVAPRVEGILSHTVLRQPVGPVAAFTPWNFPCNLPVRKLASALAAGCSVVLKPDEHTPGTAVQLVRLFHEAGVPAETLQLLCGDPPTVSTRLIDHPAIRKVSLTGSVAVGRLLAEQTARHLKRFTGELGGHAPVIVCDDADMDLLLRSALAAKFRNAGQVCASPIRFYLPRARHAQFAEDFAHGAARLRQGPGLDPQTQMGPLTHAARLDDMAALVEDALARGTRLLCGGHRADRVGYFYKPTVLADAPPDAQVMRREPFGPIAVIQPYDRLDDAIAEANALPYALGAYAFTRDLGIAHRLGEEIEAGMIGINHFGVSQPELPFGGWKDSGMGQEMGAEGLLPYTELKTVTIGSPA